MVRLIVALAGQFVGLVVQIGHILTRHLGRFGTLRSGEAGPRRELFQRQNLTVTAQRIPGHVDDLKRPYHPRDARIDGRQPVVIQQESVQP